MQSLFAALSSLVQIYSFICVVYIILSWMPEMRYSPFGRVLASICEPFLRLFRRFRFARVGVVDFSPILALGALSVISMTLRRFALTGRFSFGFLLASIIQIVWSFFSFLLTILLIFLLVRIVYDFVASNRMRGPFWVMLDNFLNPIISFVAQAFFRSGGSYRARLIATFACILIVRVGAAILVEMLARLALSIPF